PSSTAPRRGAHLARHQTRHLRGRAEARANGLLPALLPGPLVAHLALREDLATHVVQRSTVGHVSLAVKRLFITIAARIPLALATGRKRRRSSPWLPTCGRLGIHEHNPPPHDRLQARRGRP